MNNRQCNYRITKYAAANSQWSLHSQPSISLWTVGTLPPHHLWVLFITVWQHVSSGPCHYDTTHWYSPTVLQPGMQNTHAKNKVKWGETNARTCHRPMHPLYLQACVWKHAAAIHTKGSHVCSFVLLLFMAQNASDNRLSISFVFVLGLWEELCSSLDTCHQESSQMSAQMTD